MEFPPVPAPRAPRSRPAAGAAAVHRGRRGRAALAALALGWPLLGCGNDVDASGPEQRDQEVVTVESQRIEPAPLVDVAVFSGQLDAEQSVMIKPEIEGVIASVDFTQGQAVKAGDVLFRLRSREQAARLREARANRDLAGQRWKRAQQLLERDASSLSQADVARAEFEVAEARVDLAEVELERTRIRAPFDGVVGRRFVDQGDRVEEDSELVRVDSVDRLQVTFGVSDEGLPHLRTGLKVNVWVRPYPGEKFPGDVFFVSPSLDPVNRRIWVKAWIDNRDRRLAPGLFANVDLEIRRIEDALVLPESAVAIDQQGPFVWLVDADRRVSRRPIEIGLRERGIVEVIQGLQPGAEVITAGTHKVSEGERVRIAETPLVGRARQTPPEGAIIGEGT
jgi:membrane fusion protein (multidrug efflux system)